jgi:cytochrome c556
MVLRMLLAVIVVGVGITAAIAQQDPVKARKDIMETFGKNYYGVMARMARGRMPSDQVKFEEAVNAIAAQALKIQPTFATRALPAKKSDYDASPKIWDNLADFNAKAANLVKVVSENKGVAKDEATMKTVVDNIGKACDSCHDNYQVKNR